MTKPSIDQRRKTVTTLWENGTCDAYTLHKLTSIPLSTIYDYTKKLSNGISLDPKQRSGRPRKLSPKQRCHLGQLVSKNKFSTSAELANILNKHHSNLNISNRTVLNELHRLQYCSTVPKSVPLLTNKHKQCRIEFAIKYRRQNWNKVIFSDETTLQMFRNTQKVFYKCGSQPPHKAMVKHPYKIHAWGAFSVKGPIGFFLFTDIMDGALYRKILTENLFDNANNVMGNRWIFQQDNDPKHTARDTKKLLAQLCPKMLDWPSNSPDLNPIENLWQILKGRVEKQVNKVLTKKKPVTAESFREIIQKEWEGIDKKIFVNLIHSMPSRLNEVIEKNGNKISY
jgi:transposase